MAEKQARYLVASLGAESGGEARPRRLPVRSAFDAIGPVWKTKQEIAVHFQTGIRTVSKLMRERVLPYSKLRQCVRFDLAECERALEFFRTPSLLSAETTDRLHRRWKTKRQLADHLRVSERTLTTMMRERILPYLKISRIVRLELTECDRILESVKRRSIVDRRAK